MCSVLLILLLFVVIFDLVKDSAIQVHVEEKGQAKKGNCEKKLVFTSERSHHIELQSFERSEEYPQYAPFERPCLLVQDWGRNGCPRGTPTLGSAATVQDSTKRLIQLAQSANHIGARVRATTQNREAKRQHTERTPGMFGIPGIKVRRLGKATLGAGKHLHRPQGSARRAHAPGKGK